MVKTDTRSKNSLLHQETLFSERDSKLTSSDLRQKQDITRGRLQCF